MRFSLLLILLLPISALSQITLNETDFANTGDTVRMSSTTDFNVDISSTGAGFSWDFSSLVAESQNLLEFMDISNASQLVQFLFGGFAPVKYQASYFIASDDLPLDQVGTLLPVSITDVNRFSRITADSVASIGFSMKVEGSEIPFRSDLIEKRYDLPLTYQDAYTGVGYTEMDLNPVANIIWRQHRNRTSEVDGWGTMAIPMGTFDVIRVHHIIEESDSIYQELFGTPTWFGVDLPTAHIYEWWAQGEKEPVLRIESSEVGGNEVITAVEFRDNYDPMLASTEEIVLETPELYPNPATDKIHVENIPAGTTYAIINMAGQTVSNGVLSANAEVTVSSLDPGTYLFVVKSNNSWSKVSFIKE